MKYVLRGSPGVSGGLKYPVALYFVAVGALAYNILGQVFFFQSSEVTMFSALANLAYVMLFWRNRFVWIASFCWLFVPFVLSLSSGLLDTAATIEVGLKGVVLVAIVYHFRFPFLSHRSSILGFGERVKAQFEAEIEWQGSFVKVTILDISSSGISLKFSEGQNLNPIQGEAVKLKIPSLYSFQSSVEFVRKKEDGTLTFRFGGWSTDSVVQHGKVLLFLARTRTRKD